MTAKKQNIDMNEGETKKIVVSQTIDEDEGGTVDITGYQSLTWTLQHDKSGETVVEKSAEDGSITVTDPSVGAYEVTIESEDTTDEIVVAEQDFYHRVRLVDIDGNTSDLLEGTITVYEI